MVEEIDQEQVFIGEAAKLNLLEEDLATRYLYPHFNVIGTDLIIMVYRPEYKKGYKFAFLRRVGSAIERISTTEFIESCPLTMQRYVVFNLNLFKSHVRMS